MLGDQVPKPSAAPSIDSELAPSVSVADPRMPWMRSPVIRQRSPRVTAFVHRHSEGKDQFDRVMAAVRASPELTALGKDGHGEDRFTSRDMKPKSCPSRMATN